MGTENTDEHYSVTTDNDKKKKKHNQKMTHGERYFYKRSNIDFTKDTDYICKRLQNLPEKMPRAKALDYYGNKIRQHFIDIGMIEEVKIKDFIKTEHYYDAFEAERIYKKIKDSNNGDTKEQRERLCVPVWERSA